MSSDLTMPVASRALARRVTLLSTVGIVLALTACENAGGGDGGALDTPAASGQPSVPAASPVATESAAESPRPFAALGDALGVPLSARGPQSEEYYMEIEVAAADCMAAQGFPYTPYVDTRTVAREPVSGAERIAVAESEGYRLSTPFGNPELAERMAAESLGKPDPNTEYRMSLTEAGLAEWFDAYWGSPEERAQRKSELGIPPEVGNDPHAGCLGEVLGDNDPAALFGRVDTTTMEDYMGEIYERAEADPRYIAAEEKEQRCLADAGIPSGQDAGYLSIMEKLTVIVGDGEILPNAGSLDEWLAHYEIGPEIDRDALEALQADERRLASLEMTCSDAAYQVQLQVQLEAEAAWIAENEDLITAFLAEQAERAG